jgi:uncharacterized protein (TIGR02300 family)
MTKPELGTKRLCASCGAKFYDLLHSPITCPKCGAVFAATAAPTRVRSKAAPEPEREFEPAVTVPPATQFVSPTDADADADDEQGAGALPDADDDDDDDLDGAVLIEDSDQEHDDVADVHRKEED